MTTRCYNIPINQEVSAGYASDLSDQEFALIAPHVAQKSGSGKKRTVDIREVLNSIFYRVRTGCQLFCEAKNALDLRANCYRYLGKDG